MKSLIVRINGHHIMNLLYCFIPLDKKRQIARQVEDFERLRGKDFAKKSGKILEKILSENPQIKLVVKKDDFCESCPEIKRCNKSGFFEVVDERILKVFGYKKGDISSLTDILEKAKELPRKKRNLWTSVILKEMKRMELLEDGEEK